MLKYQWTDGTKPLRTTRQTHPIQESTKYEVPASNIRDHSTSESNQYASSTTSGEWDNAASSTYYSHPGSGSPMRSDTSSKEDTCIMMGEREMISQIGQNPFLYGPAAYADQVSVQDKFLKPVSSVYTDKAKPAPDINQFVAK